MTGLGYRLKAVGVTSQGRSPLVPEYPSLQEQGVLGFQLEIWTAAAAPKSMPRPIVDKLSLLVSQIARTPEVRQKLFQQGWQTAGTNADPSITSKRAVRQAPPAALISSHTRPASAAPEA